jgi:hypothetical protein
MSWYTELMGRFYNPDNISIVEIEDIDDMVNVNDEIEKALWDIKQQWDIPTEEIEVAIASRRRNLKSGPPESHQDHHLDKSLKDSDIEEFEDEIELYTTYGGD